MIKSIFIFKWQHCFGCSLGLDRCMAKEDQHSWLWCRSWGPQAHFWNHQSIPVNSKQFLHLCRYPASHDCNYFINANNSLRYQFSNLNFVFQEKPFQKMSLILLSFGKAFHNIWVGQGFVPVKFFFTNHPLIKMGAHRPLTIICSGAKQTVCNHILWSESMQWLDWW